ncbi:MAG: hypothetical protein IPO83_14110 [Chitinophagaceae bacterium]|nr:hypothetical protein [Chitinophagaceae bacterium]
MKPVLQNKILSQQQQQSPSVKMIDPAVFYRIVNARHLNLNQLLKETFTAFKTNSQKIKTDSA